LIGQRVKQLREAKGWSQDELARRVGLTSKTISNYETGTRGVKEPPLSTVRALADALGVPLDELLTEPANELLADALNSVDPGKAAG
jgi:transcriptional regulator with XRE-family HTH domain